MTQLFDPDKHVPKPCPVPGCGAIATPGQTQVPTCRIDHERAHTGDHIRRPSNCLNAFQPPGELPEGF